MALKDRFTLFLKTAKITQKEFAQKSKYSEQSLSKFITGTTKSPKIDFIITIAKYYPELNLQWLLLGEGEMFVKNTQPTNDVLLKENTQLKEENSRLKDKIIALLEKQ